MKRKTEWYGIKFIAEDDNDLKILDTLYNASKPIASEFYDDGDMETTFEKGILTALFFNR